MSPPKHKLSVGGIGWTVKIGWMYRNTTLVALDNTIISTANPYDIRKINILFVLNHAFKIN